MSETQLSLCQWIELDAEALRHNLGIFRSSLTAATQILGVVKANAYGHGVAELASVAAETVDWLGVHSASEARDLRRLGIDLPVLVMGHVPPGELHNLDRDTHLTVSSVQALEWIADYRDTSGVSLPVHLKVDTGTKRQGVPPEMVDEMIATATKKRIDVVGLASHFANIEDTLEHEFARHQLEVFRRIEDHVSRILGERPPFVHAACSAAALLFRETDFSLVRVGISMYGHWPSRETKLSWILEHGRDSLQLEPVLTWKSVIGQFQWAAKGESVGYGRTWTALRDTVLAVIPVGYADGYQRILGNRARVGVRGRAAPVVGRVCMNIFMVDVTDIPGVKLGDEVVLVGQDNDFECTAEELAGLCGTINYEFLAGLSPSIPRFVRP